MMLPTGYIPLDRRFSPRSDSDDPEALAEQSYDAFAWNWGVTTKGWSDLLEHKGVVVVLGEAGSGRTWEFRAQYDQHEARGGLVFYVQLQHLTTQALEMAIDADSLDRFKDWRRGEERAVFFFDAVDEAKLRSTEDFGLALQNIRRSLNPDHLERASIFISSRVSHWDGQLDADRVRSALLPKKGPTEDSGSAARSLAVYVIQPLDEERIERYARAKHVSDVKPFTDALREHHAWEFAGRPYDVDFLIRYWRQYSRLDHLAKMLDEMVAYQLEETKHDLAQRQALSIERARRGAEALAAASVFCKKLDFVQSPEPDASASTLDPMHCLPGDWTVNELRALLDRPLFAMPSRRRVRFQHRRTADYLAARWLERLMPECSFVAVEPLLFGRAGQTRVLRESRASVAVWLACISEEPWALELRRRILDAAPASFFRYGDPSRLPSEFKCQILDAFVRRFVGRDAVRVPTDKGSLSRMSDPAIAAAINAHLRNPEVPPGVKIELLKLATYSRVAGCVDAALELVTSDTNRGDLPGYALWVIEECASEAQKRQLVAIVEGMSSLRPSFCASVIDIVYPAVLDIDHVERWLGRVQWARENDHSAGWLLKRAFQRLETLTEQVAALKMTLRTLQPESLVDADAIWMGNCVLALLKKVLEHGALNQLATDAAAEAVWTLRQPWCQYARLDFPESKEFDLQTATLRHPDVRRKAFWLHLRQDERSGTPEAMAPDRASWVFLYELKLQTTLVDLEWLVNELEHAPNALDQEALFRFAFGVWDELKGDQSQLRRIRAAVAQRPALLKTITTTLRMRPFRKYLRWWRYHQRQGCFRAWWWEHRFHKARSWWRQALDQVWIHRHLKQIRTGKYAETIRNLLDVARSKTDRPRLTRRDWDQLRNRFSRFWRVVGMDVTIEVQLGCVAVWNDYFPELQHKTFGGEVGLVGIQLLLDSGQLDLAKMSSLDAGKAACYAMHEWDGFPEWFDQLAEHQPTAVRDVLEEVVESDWKLPANAQCGTRALNTLYWQFGCPSLLVTPHLKQHLLLADPISGDVLKTTLLLLTKANAMSAGDWASLAASRIGQYQPPDGPYLSWLSVWIQADAKAAMDHLDANLPQPSEVDPRTNAVVYLCAQLRGDHRHLPELPVRDYYNPANAERFVIMVYRYVDPARDIHRGSGSYSPEARDDAQWFRGSLVTPLAKDPNPVLTEPLQRLADAPELQTLRDYILHMLDERAERMADMQPWVEGDVRDFALHHEAMPRNLDELHECVLRRLRSIKHDVEDAEESIRDEMNAARQEAGLQSFLVRKLRERNNNCYTAPKEPEIDGQVRPDIQIHKPGIAGHVQIEIKLGDMASRTLVSLRRDLEEQLIGRYMRDQRSTHGVFVVGLAGSGCRTRWKDDDGKMISFEELIELLSQRAIELEESIERSLRLTLIGIDFRPVKPTR